MLLLDFSLFMNVIPKLESFPASPFLFLCGSSLLFFCILFLSTRFALLAAGLFFRGVYGFCRSISCSTFKITMDAKSVASQLKRSGLLRSQSFISGKWTVACDGKTTEVRLNQRRI